MWSRVFIWLVLATAIITLYMQPNHAVLTSVIK